MKEATHIKGQYYMISVMYQALFRCIGKVPHIHNLKKTKFMLTLGFLRIRMVGWLQDRNDLEEGHDR